MPQIRFTARTIAALKLPPEGRQADYFDLNMKGFGVRVGYGGAKTFFLKFVYFGRQRRMTLGPFPAVTLKAARQRLLKAKTTLANGIDPAAEKQAAQREAAEAGK